MKYRCLIVDDEPIAQELIAGYVNKISRLELVGVCNNALDAMNALHENTIDILFLDIKMPSLSGLEMLKAIPNPPDVILTTAFSEFAVESYELGVVDYLVKPISFDRFLLAVNKILLPKNARNQTKLIVDEENKFKQEFIFLKSQKKMYKYYFADILYLEGFGNYVKVHTLDKNPLLVLEKLSDLETLFPQSVFMRVHKSFIVNKDKIESLEGNTILINKNQIPVSGTYKQNLDDFMKN